jgi:ABC-2 type transport system permease protein
LNLIEDFLFKYGVRLRYDLVQDLNCGYIPLSIGQGRVGLKKWPYYPVVPPTSDNPIVKGINAVWFRFASTLDTINPRGNPGIRKTILLQTSPYTRVMLNPVRISIDLVATLQRDAQLYRQGPQNLAVLLEGSFRSNFAGRLTEETQKSGEYGQMVEHGKPAKMIVVSDGDVIANQVIQSQDQALPLGYDRFSNQTFGNKTFILNCVDYLAGENDLLNLRAKDIKLRLLDTARIKTERLKWQLLNLVLPLVILILFGLLFNYIRKRRFAG